MTSLTSNNGEGGKWSYIDMRTHIEESTKNSAFVSVCISQAQSTKVSLGKLRQLKKYLSLFQYSDFLSGIKEIFVATYFQHIIYLLMDFLTAADNKWLKLLKCNKAKE